MVSDLPTVAAAPKNGTKRQVKKDTTQARARGDILDNLGQYEYYLDECIREREQVPEKCFEAIARWKQALADHDKQHALDNSAKTMAELAEKFADIDSMV